MTYSHPWREKTYHESVAQGSVGSVAALCSHSARIKGSLHCEGPAACLADENTRFRHSCPKLQPQVTGQTPQA